MQNVELSLDLDFAYLLLFFETKTLLDWKMFEKKKRKSLLRALYFIHKYEFYDSIQEITFPESEKILLPFQSCINIVTLKMISSSLF